jgi:hypothetical protein
MMTTASFSFEFNALLLNFIGKTSSLPTLSVMKPWKESAPVQSHEEGEIGILKGHDFSRAAKQSGNPGL